jgi:hypothetical protein
MKTSRKEGKWQKTDVRSSTGNDEKVLLRLARMCIAGGFAVERMLSHSDDNATTRRMKTDSNGLRSL